MSPSSQDQIELTAARSQQFTRLACAGSTSQRLALRVAIVLLALKVGRRPRSPPDRKWRRKWNRTPDLASSTDAKRSGRPPRFTPVQIAQVKALACRPPADDRAPLPRWSCPELARQAVADDICQAISAPTVRRWLAQDAINPGSTTLTTKPSHPLSSHTTESPDSPGQFSPADDLVVVLLLTWTRCSMSLSGYTASSACSWLEPRFWL